MSEKGKQQIVNSQSPMLFSKTKSTRKIKNNSTCNIYWIERSDCLRFWMIRQTDGCPNDLNVQQLTNTRKVFLFSMLTFDWEIQIKQNLKINQIHYLFGRSFHLTHFFFLTRRKDKPQLQMTLRKHADIHSNSDISSLFVEKTTVIGSNRKKSQDFINFSITAQKATKTDQWQIDSR